jgi:hypothetical protein
LNKSVIVESGNDFKNDIIHILQNIYSKKEEIDKYLGQLKKIIYSLDKCSLAYSLYHVYLRESGIIKNDYNLLYYLNLKHPTPLFSKLYASEAESSVYLKNIGDLFVDSETIKMFQEINDIASGGKKIELSISTSQIRKDIYIAKAFAKNGNRGTAIDMLESVRFKVSKENRLDNLYIMAQLSHILYNYYLEIFSYRKAIELYLSCFFYNKNICKRLNLDPIIAYFETEESKLYHSNIFYPVIMHLYYGVSRDTYIAYDNFLFSHGVNKPSEFIKKHTNLHDKGTIMFLSHVCVQDVYFHSIYFESTDELETERIAICQKLIEIDPGRSSEYSDEIGILTQQSVVREGIRQVEQSKIYVDINGIKESGNQVLFENFSRYKEFASFSDKKEVAFLDVSDKLLAKLLGRRQEVGGSIKESKSDQTEYQIWTRVKPGYKLFTELFYDIRNRFISSNEHGLDSYLSVRIRHGTLLGHLRRQFDSEQLITQKQIGSEDTYQPNTYWENMLRIEEDSNTISIQKEFTELSRKVDLIINKLKDEYLQIKTEKKNKHGLFDYIFDEYDLTMLYKEHVTISMEYEDVLDLLFEYLWKRTDENLLRIRNVISNDLLNEFMDCLNSFENGARSLLPENYQTTELARSVANCRTNIQNELSNLSLWFTLSQGKLIHKFNFQLAIDTSVKIINNTYPNGIFNPTISVSGDINFDGKHFPAFIDILIILFNNIISHSGYQKHEIDTDVNFKCGGELLVLDVTNSVKTPELISESLQTMNDLKKSYNQIIKTDAVRREGKSGIFKIINIMNNVLGKCESNIYFFEKEVNKLSVVIQIPTNGLAYESIDN